MPEPARAPDDAPRVVLVTAPDPQAARALARALVEERLVACANLVPAVTSVYRWEGAIQEEAEVLLVLKTTAACLAELERRVGELHPYDVPEFVALRPEHVAPAYLRWLRASTEPKRGGDRPDPRGDGG